MSKRTKQSCPASTICKGILLTVPHRMRFSPNWTGVKIALAPVSSTQWYTCMGKTCVCMIGSSLSICSAIKNTRPYWANVSGTWRTPYSRHSCSVSISRYGLRSIESRWSFSDNISLVDLLVSQKDRQHSASRAVSNKSIHSIIIRSHTYFTKHAYFTSIGVVSSDVSRSICTTSFTPCCPIWCHSYVFF